MQRDGEVQQKNAQLQEHTGQPAQGVESNHAGTSTQTEHQLAVERQKAEEYLDLLRQTQADFVNYRRRISQEQTEERTKAQLTVLRDLVPVLDDFRRAMERVPQGLAHHPWVEGMLLVNKKLLALLEQLGVRVIGAPGEPFDPRWHEAVGAEERSEMPEGTILRVARPGYVLKEHVLRPAQVIVATAPPSASGGSGQHQDTAER